MLFKQVYQVCFLKLILLQKTLEYSITRGRPQSTLFCLTVSSESSLYPVIPSSMDSNLKSRPQSYCLFRVSITCARTVESLPPETPMATTSPLLNRLYLVMVLCISVSNRTKKHSLQTGLPFLGRLREALAVLHLTQSGIIISEI